MEDIHIRKVQESDINLLIEISLTTFCNSYEHLNDPADFKNYIEKAFNKKKILTEIQNPNSQFYFVFNADQLCAYYKLNFEDAQTEAKGSDYAEIERIYVKQNFKGIGIGRRIINDAISNAKSLNKTSIWLGVWDQNPSAIAFYKHVGFKKTGTHVFRIGNEDQTDYVMELELHK